MAYRIRRAVGALAIAVLVAAIPLAVGCGEDDDSESERAVQWSISPPVGPDWVRISAAIEGKGCIPDPPLLEDPIIEYKGNRVYIELRHAPEEGICPGLNLPIVFKKINLERDLDELVLFDASTDPPEQRWPTSTPLPTG